MSLASADLPSDPDALRAFALACQSELADATAELQAALSSADHGAHPEWPRECRPSPT
jgi:hypothetical protein